MERPKSRKYSALMLPPGGGGALHRSEGYFVKAFQARERLAFSGVTVSLHPPRHWPEGWGCRRKGLLGRDFKALFWLSERGRRGPERRCRQGCLQVDGEDGLAARLAGAAATGVGR